MGHESRPREAEGPELLASHNTISSSGRRKDQRWESHRDEIYEIYMLRNNTLKKTMQIIQEKYGFSPSERKYKEKLKEWKFEKYLNSTEIKFIAAKEESRAKHQGKPTAFYNRGIKISSRRIETFKKRRKQAVDEMEALPAVTPPDITYRTPLPEGDDDPLLPEETNNEATSSNSTYHTPLPEDSDNPHHLLTEQINDGATPPDSSSHTPLPGRESSTALLYAEKTREEVPTAQMQSLDLPLPIFLSSQGGHSPFHVILDHDSRHFDLSPPLGKGYKDNLGGMADISIEEIQSLAQGDPKRRKLAQVESEYIRLVNFLCKENVCGSALVFERLAQLADIYQVQNKLSESIIAYRRVLDGYRKIFGAFALETLRIVHSLGKVLEENNEYEEAEACYRLAITGFEELGSSGVLDRLNCQSFLGDLLSDMGRHQEALEILLPTLTGYQDLGLHHRKISILGSILEINISIKCWPTVDTLIRDMQNSLDERIDIDYKSFPEVLVEAIHLGSVYSQLLEYKLAEALMSQVIPKLELLDDATYEMEKIYAYIEYGKANLRLDCLEQAEFYIQSAKNRLEKLNRHDDAVASFVDACLVELEFRSLRPRARTALSRETLTQMIKGSTESEDTDNEIVCEGSRIRGEDGTDVDTSSHKYGVTFSMTSITGYSISQFLPA